MSNEGDRPGNCTICGGTSHDPECPPCSSIDYVEEEEVESIVWCKMCRDMVVLGDAKYCHVCIEEHQIMHDIGHCNHECITCEEADNERRV
jgi:hypothetical protein